VNRLMRLSLVTFVVSLGVWGVIAIWTQVRVYELIVVSGLVMLALLVHAAWARLTR